MTLTSGAIPKERGEGRRRTRGESRVHSETDMRELRLAFGMLDRNHDGRVFAEDIDHMLKTLGFDNADQDKIRAFIRSAANGGQCLREHEFIMWMKKAERTQHQNILQDAFNTLDRDRDGFISKAELLEGLKLMGENVSDKTIDLMMAEADRDEDGKINFKDFSLIMQL